MLAHSRASAKQQTQMDVYGKADFYIPKKMQVHIYVVGGHAVCFYDPRTKQPTWSQINDKGDELIEFVQVEKLDDSGEIIFSSWVVSGYEQIVVKHYAM